MQKSFLIAFAVILQTASAWALTPEEFRARAAKFAFYLEDRDNQGFMPEQYRIKARYKFEKVNFVEGATHTRIIPEYSDSLVTVKIQYDSAVEKNPALLFRDLNHLLDVGKPFFMPGKRLMELRSFNVWGEMVLNANAGHVRSQERLAHFNFKLADRQSAVPTMSLLKSMFGPLPEAEREVERNWERLSRETIELHVKAIAFEEKLNRELKSWAAADTKRDAYEKMDEKLNDLVLKNDRAGVRRMIEAYIPWVVLTPTETQAWKSWLEAIEHPSKENSILVFRGLDYVNDKVQRLELPNGEQRVALLAPVLTKNQGSYTRRLRSLITNRIQNGVSADDIVVGKDKSPNDPPPDLWQLNPPGQPNTMAVKKAKLMSPTAAIAIQFERHSGLPVASSFLSFTDDINVAGQFTEVMGESRKHQGGLIAVRVDSRRMVPNMMSILVHEKEYLAPLIIFPDEVVAFVETGKEVQASLDEFVSLVKAKTGIDPAKHALDASVFRAKGVDFMNQMSPRPRSYRSNSCGGLF